MIVYCLTNTVNGKRYVGQTGKTEISRWKEHVRVAKRGSPYPLHCAIRKHSPNVFTIEVLQRCSTQSELDAAEVYWIAELKTRLGNGYNLTEGGMGVRGKGIWNHTNEAKMKISKGNKGKVRSHE